MEIFYRINKAGTTIVMATHNKEIVDKTYDMIPAVKPQIAMYEQFGVPGIAAFKKTVDITGLVLTKLDGTAKGGVVIGIVAENKIPVKFIGVGEQIDDMEIFNSEEFVNAII